MKRVLDQIRAFMIDVVKTAKVRKRLLAVLAVFIFLQLYFVRELIAAELLFGLGFAVLLFIVGIFYVVGAIGERVIDATETGALVVADSARRGYTKASPVLDAAAKRGIVLTEIGAEAIARSARRGYTKASPALDAAAKRGLVLIEAGAKAIARSALRGFHKVEEISKKPFRHPRSESAR
jgi:ribosomal protein S20